MGGDGGGGVVLSGSALAGPHRPPNRPSLSFWTAGALLGFQSIRFCAFGTSATSHVQHACLHHVHGPKWRTA